MITPVFNTYLKRVSFCECGNRKLAASHLKNTSDGLVLRLQKQNAPPEVIRQRIGSEQRVQLTPEKPCPIRFRAINSKPTPSSMRTLELGSGMVGVDTTPNPKVPQPVYP